MYIMQQNAGGGFFSLEEEVMVTTYQEKLQDNNIKAILMFLSKLPSVLSVSLLVILVYVSYKLSDPLLFIIFGLYAVVSLCGKYNLN